MMLSPDYFAYKSAYQRMLCIVYLLQVELFYASTRVVLSSPPADSAQGNIMAKCRIRLKQVVDRIADGNVGLL